MNRESDVSIAARGGLLRLEVSAQGVRSSFEARPTFGAPLDAVARLGGPGLGLAALAEAAPSAAEPAPLVVAVGDAVRRGVPTAVRATVLSRAALGGRVAQGQVGGSLGARLASLADALIVSGSRAPAGSVLIVESDGSARLEQPPLPDDLPARTAFLSARYDTDAVLAVGRAAERGVRFASLAAGGVQPSFVGRGGLALGLARTGVVALVLRATPAEPRGERALAELLLRSPRLATRSAAGSLELWHQAAAGGALSDASGRVLDGAEGAAWSHEAERRGAERHGCRGCPTPCGWTFETKAGGARTARFAATRALGPELGLEHFEDSLRLLEAADRVGVDSKELGAALAVLGQVAQQLGVADPRGDVAALEAWIERLGHEGVPFADGADALAKRTGSEFHALHGQAAQLHTDRARLLGQCVGGGGVDPMRTFTVLSDSAGLDAWRAWLAPLEVSSEMLDPDRPAGKGRLVAFQEELLAGIDLSGFCAFSAGALLADGIASLDELAERIAQPSDASGASSAGQRLRIAGATYLVVRRWLDERWGATPTDERPAWARTSLDEPGMLDEYRACRGLELDGRTSGELLARLGTARLLAPVRALAPLGERSTEPARGEDRVAVHVALRAIGPLEATLAADLGSTLELAVPAPGTVAGLLELLASLATTGRFLGPARPSVWRAGRRLAPEADLASGDVLDLVLAISGG